MVSAAPDIVAGKAGRIMTRKAPKIIDVTEQRFEELLHRAESNSLRDDDMELMCQIFASYRGLFQLVGDKNTTIARLRKLILVRRPEIERRLGDAVPNVHSSDWARKLR